MSWTLFWTILGQVAVASVSLRLLLVPWEFWLVAHREQKRLERERRIEL